MENNNAHETIIVDSNLEIVQSKVFQPADLALMDVPVYLCSIADLETV